LISVIYFKKIEVIVSNSCVEFGEVLTRVGH
jgi:hypothetical protein